MSATSDDADPPNVPVTIALGSRLRRPLTPEEVASLRAVRRRGRAFDAAQRTIVALWDILLGDAEGTTYSEAAESGRRFDVHDYAIPERQAADVAVLLAGRLSPRERTAIRLTWLDLGPATYNDDDPT